MNCNKCGVENAESSKFCGKCGQLLVQRMNNAPLTFEWLDSLISLVVILIVILAIGLTFYDANQNDLAKSTSHKQEKINKVVQSDEPVAPVNEQSYKEVLHAMSEQDLEHELAIDKEKLHDAQVLSTRCFMVDARIEKPSEAECSGAMEAMNQAGARVAEVASEMGERRASQISQQPARRPCDLSEQGRKAYHGADYYKLPDAGC